MEHALFCLALTVRKIKASPGGGRGGQVRQILPCEVKVCRKCSRKHGVEKLHAFDATANSVHTVDVAHMPFILTRKLKFSLQRDAPNWRLETQVKSALSQSTLWFEARGLNYLGVW